MSATVIGNQLEGLVRQPGSTIIQRDDGTWEGTVEFICRWSLALDLAPQRNVASHPDFPGLLCKGCQIVQMKPSLVAKLTATYRGIVGGQEGDPPPSEDFNSTEEVITSMSEAPIETHPNFVTQIGGTAAAPLNDAIFDENGEFKGWKATSQFRGIESFLIPSTAYRKTTPTRSRPTSVGAVGSIVSPGIGSNVPGANWLFTCRSWRRDGGVYEVSEEYMLSGPGGWNSIIYG